MSIESAGSGPGVGIPLKTLLPSGAVPESRLTDPTEAREMVDAMLRAYELRAIVDARVKGLIDGNPPYRDADLEKAGQSWRTNANFREAEAFIATGLSAFYDVFHEVPTYSNVETFYSDDLDRRAKWSQVITEEFDLLNREDRTLDYTIQLSQFNMVTYNMGPAIWENETDYRCRALKHNRVLVPDGTPSNLDEWEACAVLVDYKVHKLYENIVNPEFAARIGWDVEFVRDQIINAQPDSWRTSQNWRNWEWVQQRIRNNDITFAVRSKVVPTAHVFWKEFPEKGQREGRVSHGIISMMAWGSNEPPTRGKAPRWLFRHVGRYANWRNVICPFYYDKGDGDHHSVKGMGIKFHRALETKNRLQSHIVDAAFARAAIMFTPSSPEIAQDFSVAPVGPYHVAPFGYQFTQTAVGGVLDAPMAVSRELLLTVTSNLSQYRQNLQRTEGNPLTATEVEYRASQQSVLGKTQLTRYYEQLDDFWAERYRRAANPNITEANRGGFEALRFQKRCLDRGVPIEALQKVTVRATRAIGQGSSFLRQASLQEILGILPLLPEAGRSPVIRDWIAAKGGQTAADRYAPEAEEALPGDQEWQANQENATMRVGALPVITGTQNHVIHAQSHLSAASAAANSLQQGADPNTVLAFIDIAGAHTAEHLARISNDPTRKGVADAIGDQLKDLAKIADGLRDQIKQNQKQQAEAQATAQQAQAVQQGMDPEIALKKARQDADIQMKNRKVDDDLERKHRKLQADIAAKDAKTAAGIMLDKAKAQAATAQPKKE